MEVQASEELALLKRLLQASRLPDPRLPIRPDELSAADILLAAGLVSGGGERDGLWSIYLLL